ncbi:uncharacterized protein LOC144007754 [Festucalex cinctus]
MCTTGKMTPTRVAFVSGLEVKTPNQPSRLPSSVKCRLEEEPNGMRQSNKGVEAPALVRATERKWTFCFFGGDKKKQQPLTCVKLQEAHAGRWKMLQPRNKCEESSCCCSLESIHPPSAYQRSGLGGSSFRRGNPDLPLPSHFNQLLRRDPKAFPGQPRDSLVSPACPGGIRTRCPSHLHWNRPLQTTFDTLYFTLTEHLFSLCLVWG